ncbi:MAG: tRNA lysidine(34) synthetase TilS [Treponema sp.]|nr:tRNA lysidine(34) synthetase TilS [Treponema sp.]
MFTSFETAVLAGLNTFFAGKPGKHTVLAALSGGADSTAMIAALASLRKAVPLELHALYVNHGIRPPEKCAADECAAGALCKKLDIPFSIKKFPSGAIDAHARQCGTGIEGAARYFRYTALRKEARRLGADAILTAHTANDRLETILMAFFRGSGPAGLGAMNSPPAEFAGIRYGQEESPDPPIVRPLLFLSRSDILEYLKYRDLSHCIDETNTDERFFRNKVRLRLIPVLDQHFPQWRESALRLGETQAMAATFLAEEAEKRLSWIHDSANSHLSLSAETFFSQPEILREEALFQAIDILARTGGESLITEQPRRKAIRSFARGGTAANLGRFLLENKKGRIGVKKTPPLFTEDGFSVLIKKAGVYKLEGLTITASLEHIDSGGMVFFGQLPAVIRSVNGKILAEDRDGRAAVIQPEGTGVLVWKREHSPGTGGLSFAIQINGGSC